MDVDALSTQIATDRAAGFHPVCVVATAGDVNTGAIDPLDAIADVCARARSCGCTSTARTARSPRDRRMSAARCARSVAPIRCRSIRTSGCSRRLDAGCLLVRDAAALQRAFSTGAGYIDVVADRDMSEFAFWDHSPELSRRFRALKIWFLLKVHGARAIQDAIDGNIAVAQHLAQIVEASADFELMAPAPLSIVCFRYRRAETMTFNKRLMVEVQRDGDSYLSNATINGRFALRACIVNFRTTPPTSSACSTRSARVAARMT